MNRWTASQIKDMKGHGKVKCLTAYDYSMARLVDAAGVQIVLVGDSLANVVLGYETTIPVTMEDMLHHTRAVARGVEHALVVGDMPFMSYQISDESGLANAGRLIKEANAGAVKVEGGAIRAGLIRRLVENGIPVLGHIGLTPQSVHQLGGFKVQGKAKDDAQRLIEDAGALAEAGVFGIVLECMPAELANEITRRVSVPTIGIGAGAGCDGQVLVTADLLGMCGKSRPKFVKQYADLGTVIAKALQAYCQDIDAGTFPGPEHSY